MPRPSLRPLVVLLAVLGLMHCKKDDEPLVVEEPGMTMLVIANEGDVPLRHTFVRGTEPVDVLTTEIPARSQTEILRYSGFGYSPPPEKMIKKLTLSRATDGATVLTLDPVANSDWTLLERGQSEPYVNYYSLTVSKQRASPNDGGLADAAVQEER